MLSSGPRLLATRVRGGRLPKEVTGQSGIRDRHQRGRCHPSELPALSAQSFSVVEQQGAHIPAEWLLQLGSVLRGRAGHSGDLGIARGLIHG